MSDEQERRYKAVKAATGIDQLMRDAMVEVAIWGSAVIKDGKVVRRRIGCDCGETPA